LAGHQVAAELGMRGHGAGLAAAPDSAAFEIPSIAMEHAAFSGPVAFGGQQGGRVTRQAAGEQVDVGLLAGLEDAEVGVDRAECGDDPVGSRFRAVHGPVPRRPAFAFRRGVGVGVNGEAVGLPAVGEMVRHCGSPRV
jgi:hypothetical protein